MFYLISYVDYDPSDCRMELQAAVSDSDCCAIILPPAGGLCPEMDYLQAEYVCVCLFKEELERSLNYGQP